MIAKSTYENPHTFEEAKQWLGEGNWIDYEVLVGGHGGALMTRETWLDSVKDGLFIDYDGMGDEIDESGSVLGETPTVREGDTIKQFGVSGWIKPSEASRIRPETRYILWYNR